MSLRKRTRRHKLLEGATRAGLDSFAEAAAMRRVRSRLRGNARPAEFTVRPARESDYEGLCAVMAEADTLHVRGVPDVFRRQDGPVRSLEFICSLLQDPRTGLFVAESQGRIVGMAHIDIRESPDVPVFKPREYAVIADIVVTRRLRRQGIGRALAESCHRWAVEQGVHQVELNVWEFNKAAIAFYTRLGYRTATRRLRRRLDG
jgi:GNAT superfamily N-acetyltransferase